MAFLKRIFKNKETQNLLRESVAPPFRPPRPPFSRPSRRGGLFGRLFDRLEKKVNIPEPQPIIDPVIIPPRPPSIGGVGGINQNFQPVLQQPQAPRTGGIPVTGGGPLGSGILPIANLPTGPVSPPTNIGTPISDTPIGGISAVQLPTPQTGLTAAELLELSDEELLKYIPRRSLRTRPGAKPIDATPSPEEFRKTLQAEIDLKPGDRGFDRLGLGPRLYNPIDTSPPTPEEIEASRQRKLLSIPVPEITGLNLREVPPQDFGFGPSIRPTEIRDEQGNIIVGSAGVTPPVVPPVVTPDPIIEPVVTPDPIIKPAPTTPAAVASDVGAVPVTTIPQDVRGQVDPVLAQQDTQEILTDPLLRALYFGTADQPGFINQLQQATANLIGSDVPLQQTAGLSELEQIAQDRALADLGVAEPFVGESADLIRGTTRQFDPSMTQQFFNPFEDQVVQQTIQDVLEAGEKRDIQQRARDIQTGGLSAFGSRARLTAADRQEALGRGLAEALGGIRQAGFGQAQRDALTTFAQQRQAEQQAARDIGQVGSTLADLRARERAGLAGFGQTGRDIEETGLSRLFQQQLDQQGRPLQALQLTGQLLPQFQAGQTRIDSEYRLPVDPSARGLGAAFSAFTALAPGQTNDLSGLGAAFSGYGAT